MRDPYGDKGRLEARPGLRAHTLAENMPGATS